MSVRPQPLPVQPLAPGGVTARIGTRVIDWLPAAIVLVGGIGAWEGIVKGAHIQRFLLPAPSAIWTAFLDNQHQLWHEGLFTVQEALGGFAIGCAFGILLALVVARWKLLGSALMPYAIAANAIPIIAFAPITNAWFDPLTKLSKMVIAAILCFFPVFVNVVRGLRSVNPQQIELMRSYAAGEFTIFRLVRVPTALPFLFTGLKVATVLAMIGAVVGEYFGGALNALGVQILTRSRVAQYQEAWAGILVACLLGIALYLAVALIERLTLRWVPSTSE